MSNEIKLSEDTMRILEKMYKINQCLKIKPGQQLVKSVNETRSLAAFSKIDEVFPKEFNVYDLSEFIRVVNIVEDPILEFHDAYIIIKNPSGTQKLKYIQCEPDLITSYFDAELILEDEDVELTIEEETLKRVFKAASTMSLEYIGFKADGENLYFSAFNRRVEGDDQETGSFDVKISEIDDQFNIFCKTKLLIGVLDGESKFTIQKKNIRASIECGNMEYFITFAKESEV